MKPFAVVLCVVLVALLGLSQQALQLGQVTKIYVQDADTDLSRGIVHWLQDWGKLVIVSDPSQADAILVAEGPKDLKIRGSLRGDVVGTFSATAEVALLDAKTQTEIWRGKKREKVTVKAYGREPDVDAELSAKQAREIVKQLRKDWEKSAKKAAGHS